jgi:hypothetical protein
MTRLGAVAVVLFLCVAAASASASASRTREEILKDLDDLVLNGTVTLAPTVPNPDACAKALSEASAAIYEVIEWNQYIAACRHVTQQTCLSRGEMVNKLYARQLRYIAAYMKLGVLCFPKHVKADNDEYDVYDEEKADV